MCSTTVIDANDAGCLMHSSGAIRDVDGHHKAISFVQALVTLMRTTTAASSIQAVPILTLMAFTNAVSLIQALAVVTLMILPKAVSSSRSFHS